MNCKRCKIEMKTGFAIPPAIVGTGTGTMSYGWWRCIAPLVAVLKCPKCGYSITK